MINHKLVTRGLSTLVTVVALTASFPAAAKSWKCACRLEVTNPGFKWLTFHHSFEEFELVGYGGNSEEEASRKCGEVVSERHHHFEIGALLTIADTKILSAQKSAWKSKRTSLCKEAEKIGATKLDEETDWALECRAYESSSGKKEATKEIKVGSGHAVGSTITCGGE